ncbi:MAG TPA: SPFH domain-containing protein [Kofleriaceae bacterium]
MTKELVMALIGIGSVFLLGIVVLFVRSWRQVHQGQAMIVNKMGSEPKVTFSGAVVFPIVNKAEVMDLSVKTIEVARKGKEGLICADNIRADIKVTFFVSINKTVDDVLRVAQTIGCARASQQETLEELFQAKFSEALKTVGKNMEFEQLYTQRQDFKNNIKKVIGEDLNGYVLDDCAIDYLEQTPIEMLDPNNVLDALGIRKITDITSIAAIDTNQLKQRQRMEVGRQDLTAQEAMFRFEQAQAEAEAKKNKEVQVATAREMNEAMRFQLEEERRTQIEKQRADEAIQMAEQAKLRSVQISEQGRIREVEVEKVRVQKAHDLEEVGRSREVSLTQIEMNKQVETEKRSIADIIRARVVVDKTVAVEEESIKDLRMDADVKRKKNVTIVTAEADAQGLFIKDIKQAEAEQQVAQAHAKKQLILAEATMEASDKEARAAMRRAEGTQAEAAAEGLAQARVKEAEAVAIEKRIIAEATGLAEKTRAMQELKGDAREHEEFRLRLDADRSIALEQIKARVQMAEAQAKVLGETMGHADIKIVGGDGQFFDRFIKAVSLGSSIDGIFESSDVVRKVVGDKLDGAKSLNGALNNVMMTADEPTKAKLTSLIDQAKKLGSRES